MIDLGRWLDQRYAVPCEPEEALHCEPEEALPCEPEETVDQVEEQQHGSPPAVRGTQPKG
jgi:endogenous inhibitor of DNA gyrase (YacG/DUF329 family)